MIKENIEVFDSNEARDPDTFYASFKEKLNEALKFPANYMYKFIVPNDQGKIAMLHAIFENARNASFSSKESRNGKYTSLTVTISAKDADEVISYYKEVASIKDVMML